MTWLCLEAHMSINCLANIPALHNVYVFKICHTLPVHHISSDYSLFLQQRLGACGMLPNDFSCAMPLCTPPLPACKQLLFFKHPCIGVTVFGFLWGPGTTYVQCASMQVIACLLAMPRIYIHLTKRHLTKTACGVYIFSFFHLTSSTISRTHLYTPTASHCK